MKTYQKTITVPRLEIKHENWPESPRKWSNIGFLFTKEGRYSSPDGTNHPLYSIMIETEDEATDTAQHIELMKARASEAFKASSPKDGSSHDESLHVIDIYPVYRYEHGNVAYRRGTAGGFDYSNCGFYFVTAEGISGAIWDTEKIEKAIDAELETYTQWCNGEVYSFVLYAEDGSVEDSCGGFYDIDDIMDALPEDFKGETLSEYVID